MAMDKSFDTIVIGGGQAGLAAGYFLKQHSRDFIILDAAPRTGETWRSRWDSLRLFTPSHFDSLPGLEFPGPASYFPTKDEIADYLDNYARHFDLPIQHGVRVEKLSRNGAGFELSAGSGFAARQVIVATGPYQQPRIPSFANELDPAIQQLHSTAYRNPDQLAAQNVLVVGAGNSGAEISLELARAGKHVWLAGRNVGHIPADTLGRPFGGRPYWWFISHIMTENTPIGRRMKASVLHHGNPLIRTTRQDLAAAGVEATGRVVSIEAGKPRLEDGRVLPAEAVVWTTGFRPDYSWIDLPIFDEYGLPRHQRGTVDDAPGLFFVGLHFQTGLSSALLGGVSADAKSVVERLASGKRLN
jgi:putative flavoprotein involved in K+ transport